MVDLFVKFVQDELCVMISIIFFGVIQRIQAWSISRSSNNLEFKLLRCGFAVMDDDNCFVEKLCGMNTEYSRVTPIVMSRPQTLFPIDKSDELNELL